MASYGSQTSTGTGNISRPLIPAPAPAPAAPANTGYQNTTQGGGKFSGSTYSPPASGGSSGGSHAPAAPSGPPPALVHLLGVGTQQAAQLWGQAQTVVGMSQKWGVPVTNLFSQIDKPPPGLDKAVSFALSQGAHQVSADAKAAAQVGALSGAGAPPSASSTRGAVIGANPPSTVLSGVKPSGPVGGPIGAAGQSIPGATIQAGSKLAQALIGGSPQQQGPKLPVGNPGQLWNLAQTGKISSLSPTAPDNLAGATPAGPGGVSKIPSGQLDKLIGGLPATPAPGGSQRGLGIAPVNPGALQGGSSNPFAGALGTFGPPAAPSPTATPGAQAPSASLQQQLSAALANPKGISPLVPPDAVAQAAKQAQPASAAAQGSLASALQGVNLKPGKISFFGGAGDSQGTATGIPTSTPGIAVYNQQTKGGYWLVKMPNGQAAVLKQTDIGPAPWTGRTTDFTNGALAPLGYTSGNFPTDATAQTAYLGQQVPPALKGLVLGEGGKAVSASQLQSQAQPAQQQAPGLQQIVANAAKLGTQTQPAANPVNLLNSKPSPQTFAVALLKGLNAPLSPQNLQLLVGWQKAEGGHWNNSATYNPLNTTLNAPGASVMAGGNTSGVKAYSSWQQGLQATINTLKLGGHGYEGIVGALQKSDPQAAMQAINQSGWLPGGYGSGLQQAVSQTPAGGGVPQQLIQAVNGGGGQQGPQPGAYVNPIPGATLSRTDMGVDASMKPGSPIVAMGDSVFKGTNQNWYSGQPYLSFQLTSGPQAGKYWYVAEAINPVNLQPGQQVKAGQTIGTYNAGGTGLELGWGTATPGQTASAASGSANVPSHSNTPEGQNFRAFLTGLSNSPSNPSVPPLSDMAASGGGSSGGSGGGASSGGGSAAGGAASSSGAAAPGATSAQDAVLQSILGGSSSGSTTNPWLQYFQQNTPSGLWDVGSGSAKTTDPFSISLAHASLQALAGTKLTTPKVK